MGGRACCRLSEAGQHILTLTVRKGKLRLVPRSRTYLVTARARRLLRPVAISAAREESTSRSPDDAKLELGSHRISQELRDLRLGRMVLCQYAPSAQTILTPVLESFAI